MTESTDAEVIDLAATQTLRRVVGPGDFEVANRILRKIVRARQEDADELIAWMVREQLREAKRAAEKARQRTAAIAAAKARAGERRGTGDER